MTWLRARWWRRYLCSVAIVSAAWFGGLFALGYVTGPRERLDAWSVLGAILYAAGISALPRSNRRDRPTQAEVLAAVDPATRRELEHTRVNGAQKEPARPHSPAGLRPHEH
jgi:hypothetical protein